MIVGKKSDSNFVVNDLQCTIVSENYLQIIVSLHTQTL